MQERDDTFNAHLKIAQQKYDLKTLEYSKEDKTWKIESALFIGDSRLKAKRKTIGATERSEIIGKIQEVIQKELLIEFEDFHEFFATE